MNPRRNFLKSSTALLLLPKFLSAGDKKNTNSNAKRLVCIGNYLGYHAPSFYPKQAGENYEMPQLLSPLKNNRNDFSIFSGLDHRAKNGHANWHNFITGYDFPRLSLDQLVAEKIGHQTRFNSLQLAIGNEQTVRMSYTREGVTLPCIQRPHVLFSSIFTSGSNKSKMLYDLNVGRSIIDDLLDEAKTFSKKLDKNDKNKMSQYLQSVRDVETEIQKQKSFLNKPLRKVDYKYKEPAVDLFTYERTFMDLIAVAFETDSTRVATLMQAINNTTKVNGKRLSSLHGLSHHNKNKGQIAKFNMSTQQHLVSLSRFIKTLKERTDLEGKPLLDSTIILLGSGMGDANTHSNANIPTIVAGGGFKHGSHIQTTKKDPYLLGDLYISILQRMGFEDTTFAKAKNNMNHVFKA